MYALNRLISQAGGYADMERQVPELYDLVYRSPAQTLLSGVQLMGGGLLVSWSPDATLDRRQCGARTQYVTNDSASKPGVAARRRSKEKTKRYGLAVRSLVFETCGRLGGEGTRLLRDLVTIAAVNGQCSPYSVGRWRTRLGRVLMSAQADTCLRALGSRACAVGAAERRTSAALLRQTE